MTRAFVTSTLAVLAGAVVVVASARQTQFQSAVHTVSIHATAVDAQGRVVTDLQRDDFEVYDDGRRQALTLFDNGIQPITIVVMLDRSGSVRAHFDLVRDAAKAFVANLLPDDRARIGSFADSIRIGPDRFTSDQQELTRILDHDLLPAGGTPLWNATSSALDALSAEAGRRVVLIFTDGWDTPGLGRNISYEALLQRVQREETMLYAIGLSAECQGNADAGTGTAAPALDQVGRGFPAPPTQFPRPPVPFPGRGWPPRAPEPLPQPWARPADLPCREQGPDPALRELAAVGGGGYFGLRSRHDLAATFSRIAYELHSQYLLAFTPTELDGRTHELDVLVNRPGVTIRARKTYQAQAR
jgi:VWFA-related protein